MLVLSAVTDSIKVQLAGAVTTTQLDLVASWRDITSTPSYVAGRSAEVTNNTTAVILIAAPAASTQRVIDFVSIYNADTVAATVTVRLDTGTLYVLTKATIAVGGKLLYTNEEGWCLYDAAAFKQYIGATGATGATGSTGATGATGAAGPSTITIGTTTITSGTSGRVLYDNAGAVGEMTTTGSGTQLVLAAGPTITGTILVQQTGGTAGTDEIQISHNGTHGIIRNMDTTGSLFLYGSPSGGSYVRVSGDNTYTDINGSVNFGRTSNLRLNMVDTTYTLGWSGLTLGYQAAGVLQIGTSNNGDAAGSLKCTAATLTGTLTAVAGTFTGAVKLATKTIATLPSAASSSGERYQLSDSATIVNRIAFSNGTAWYYEGTAVAV